MVKIKERDFVRLFILELILVQKESAFDLWDDETVDLPNNYMTIFDKITEDDVKKVRYQDLIPVENKEEWKYNVTSGLNDFFNSSGVTHTYKNNAIRINLNREAISKILFDERFDYSFKGKVACLAEDFLVTSSKEKEKQKTLK